MPQCHLCDSPENIYSEGGVREEKEEVIGRRRRAKNRTRGPCWGTDAQIVALISIRLNIQILIMGLKI